ncbi:hypothetical protein PpBr36_00540 [Pyricularia pennisetigena]|uniref:hypothetical protein n=1 Tax=Pyricularia pennisetigena TaxID=1578925 RepID=UPI0011505854|nr:hypothetical protein PpBr36_00540 [Pyricularia pennisetigena]TLS28860.1 hypothetical protein PpBr36_00540 [Pyricularia pennisetigena]
MLASAARNGPGHGAQPAAYGGGPAPPAGTFTPGTKIQVGSHRVVIQKYLSEGGFAHVYLVKLPQPVSGTDLAVLKRVAVPDKEALRGMRTEVETMKRLKGHRAIVTYIDSHASELRGGGYEVFLLMEYCDGGGLIDFMNTRLQHRLTEPEILNIFTDVAEGVACMHYLKPPLLHRDLKVENVLITMYGSVRKFKLCDFGSAAPPRPAPTTVAECRATDEDVQKHTTMQYRSPEMTDVYRKQPIDEKSDIWALGVLLYKLCYYTTPFEDQGQLAILNASYKYPSYPVFSDRLKQLIAAMLKENPQSRPNIYQVLKEGCAMQGKEPPIKDIYSGKPRTTPQTSSRPTAADQPSHAPVVGASFAPAAKQQQAIPEIAPMRRGRPTAATTLPTQPGASPSSKPKPSPSPMRITNGDPFAALDSKTAGVPGKGDELSSRFPTLDQFSLLHDHGSKFNFDDSSSPETSRRDIGQRITERLADDAFARSSSPEKQSQQPPQAAYTNNPAIVSPPIHSASAPPRTNDMSRASAIIAQTPELQAIASPELKQQSPPKPKPAMVSTGTMTTTPPSERPPQFQSYQRYPDRSSSMPKPKETENLGQSPSDPSAARVSTYPPVSTHVHNSSSSRPSLEGGRPSLDMLDAAYRTTSQSSRPRPVSTYMESNLEYLREKEKSTKPSPSPGLSSGRNSAFMSPPPPEPSEEANIASNVDFLRSMEESDSKKTSKQGKRSSLTSLSSGTKNIFAGKFSDAFKRFEHNNNNNNSAPPPARTPSPLKSLGRHHDLTPIAGSEATDGRSDDGQVLEETDDMTPEMRREVERRRLSEEERRVAAAGAEYRKRLADREPGAAQAGLPKSIGGVSRAVSIQNKVQNLLDETQKAANVTRTAQGYGHFTESSAQELERPEIPRKPVGGVMRSNVGLGMGLETKRAAPPVGMKPDVRQVSLVPSTSGRPTAPPKPTHLYKNLTSGGGRPMSPPKPSSLNKPLPHRPPLGQQEQLMAPSLPGQPVLDMTAQEKDDYLNDFQKRFPSLGAIEMVERDLGAEAAGGRDRER